MKILGVLGGMGPQASIHFYDLLIRISIKKYGVQKNADFPHILIDNIPVPDLVKSKEDENKTVAIVEEEARRLGRAGAEVLAMPCNTMHLYVERFQQASSLPFISMIDAVLKKVETDKIKKVGLLGSMTTMKSTLYTNPLRKKGIEIVLPDEQNQKIIGDLIHTVIASEHGDTERIALKKIIQQLKKDGAEGIILGCTELPLLAKDIQSDVPLYDSLTILAEECCAAIL